MVTASALDQDQRVKLEGIAAGDSVHSQRAHALLALDGGATQAAAAKEAGLSISAVRYWRNKFMDQGFAIFPEGLTDDSPPEVAEPEKKQESKGGKKNAKKKGKSGKKGKKKKKKKKGKK